MTQQFMLLRIDRVHHVAAVEMVVLEKKQRRQNYIFKNRSRKKYTC